MTPLRSAFNLAYEASPIILTGGVASLMPLGLPILTLTQSLSAINALPTLNGGVFDSFAVTFRPLPGSQIIKNDVAEFPFYTNNIAANAQIPQPLTISMLMYFPANNNTPFVVKTAAMLALQATLQNHTNAGGSYTVITPSAIYNGCLLRAITDVSGGETNQSQYAYQWDFEQPLLTFPAGGGVLNRLMSDVTNGIGKLSKAVGSLV